jgi:hypothetical protein
VGSVDFKGALCALCTLVACAQTASAAAAALDPVVEAKNYAKTLERQRIYDAPDYQAKLHVVSGQNSANALAIQAADPEHDPFSQLLDGHVGLAGLSYGAAGVSYIGQWDPASTRSWRGTTAVSRRRAPRTAASRPARRTARPTPRTGRRGPATSRRSACRPTTSCRRPPTHQSRAARAILVSWYTTAWFDKYVKRDPTADGKLLGDRWRHDALEADPDGDANTFSFYHRSRLYFTRADGTQVDCEDLRAGCAFLSSDDGYPGDYSYATVDRSPDR